MTNIPIKHSAELCDLCNKPLPHFYIDYTTYPKFCDECKKVSEAKRSERLTQYLTALENAMDWMPAGYADAQFDREAYLLPVEKVIGLLRMELERLKAKAK